MIEFSNLEWLPGEQVVQVRFGVMFNLVLKTVFNKMCRLDELVTQVVAVFVSGWLSFYQIWCCSEAQQGCAATGSLIMYITLWVSDRQDMIGRRGDQNVKSGSTSDDR